MNLIHITEYPTTRSRRTTGTGRRRPTVSRWVVWCGALLTFAAGCSGRTPSEPPVPSTPRSTEESDAAADQPLRITVVDDPTLAEAIRREWSAHLGDAMEVQEVTEQDFSIETTRSCDVVVFPSAWLGELAQAQAIRALPTEQLQSDRQPNANGETASSEWKDLLPLIRQQELRWGNATYGLPFGSPQLLLVYRADLFQRWELKPPRTWPEYQLLLERLRERIAAEGENLQATAEPLGPGWAARVLLARAAAYAKHPNQYSTLFRLTDLQPLIDGPPFVRALEEMQAARAFQPLEGASWGPAEAARAMLSGQVAMAITWPSAARTEIAQADTSVTFAFHHLPGADEVYHSGRQAWETRRTDSVRHVPLLGVSGRIGAITRGCRRLDRAMNVLQWLTSAEQAARIAARSPHTTLYRNSSLTQAMRWVEPQFGSQADAYGSIVAEVQQHSSWFSVPRIPGHREYLHELDQAVRQVVTEQTSASETLQQTARKWSELHDQLDRTKQIEAYQLDLGLSL